MSSNDSKPTATKEAPGSCGTGQQTEINQDSNICRESTTGKVDSHAHFIMAASGSLAEPDFTRWHRGTDEDIKYLSLEHGSATINVTQALATASRLLSEEFPAISSKTIAHALIAEIRAYHFLASEVSDTPACLLLLEKRAKEASDTKGQKDIETRLALHARDVQEKIQLLAGALFIRGGNTLKLIAIAAGMNPRVTA